MAHEAPPTNEEILAKVSQHPEGLTPKQFVDAFEADGYTHDQVISAIQRAFDKGQLKLSTGARLVPTKAVDRVPA